MSLSKPSQMRSHQFVTIRYTEAPAVTFCNKKIFPGHIGTTQVGYRVTQDRNIAEIWMDLEHDRPTREKAWKAVRLAVRAYARDPSDDNAAGVQRSWATLREIETKSTQIPRSAIRSDRPYHSVRVHCA